MSLRIALLASGRGSNVEAILRAILDQHLPIQPVCVLSNVEDAPVLDVAKDFQVPALSVPHRGLSRESHEAQVITALDKFKPDYVVLAGYMRLLTPQFLAHFKESLYYRILNIHPSLLPAFAGADGYQEAFDYGVKVAGVTVHFVDEKMDHGPILLQETFERRDDDTVETFKARGLAVEHKLYPKALNLLAQKRVRFVKNPQTSRVYVEIAPHVPASV